jgi:hypothetical protein
VPISVPKRDPITIIPHPTPTTNSIKNGPEIVNFRPVLLSLAALANRRLQPLGHLTVSILLKILTIRRGLIRLCSSLCSSSPNLRSSVHLDGRFADHRLVNDSIAAIPPPSSGPPSASRIATDRGTPSRSRFLTAVLLKSSGTHATPGPQSALAGRLAIRGHSRAPRWKTRTCVENPQLLELLRRTAPLDASTAVAFTETYLLVFEEELTKAKDPGGLIEAMKERFPSAGLLLAIERGATANVTP